MTYIDPELLKPRDLTAFRRTTFPPRLVNIARRIVPKPPIQETKSIVFNNEAERQRAADQIATMQNIEAARAAIARTSKFKLDSSVKVHEITATVAAYFGISVPDIKGYRRHAEIVRARQIVYYLSKELTRRSYPDIGRQMNRDHTSVLYGSRKIAILIETDKALAEDIEALKQIICPQHQEAAE